jgi:hypothetical protein
MKLTLYVNTYHIETELDEYIDYCHKFASANNMELIEYQSLNDWCPDCYEENDSEFSGEYFDSENDSFRALGLWSDYCNGVEIKNYNFDK